MCNCVRKCVGFRRFPQFIVILPGKRFAVDSRAKSPLPSHKKAPAGNSTTSLRAATFDFTRSGRPGSVSLLPSGAKSGVFSSGACRRSFPNARLWSGASGHSFRCSLKSLLFLYIKCVRSNPTFRTILLRAKSHGRRLITAAS